MRCVSALACASLLLACSPVASHARVSDDGSGVSPLEAARRQLVVRLRSFVPGASGRVVVDPSDEGGRVRLLASGLRAPGTIAAGASVYVVWATGGEVRRVGELRPNARGDASFEFAHPAGFASYSLVVTAERDARATYPTGAFVFSTRAGEVTAFYPPKPEPRATAKESAPAEEGTGTNPRASAPAVRSRTVTNARANAAATNAPPTPTGARTAPTPAGERAPSSSTSARVSPPPTSERATPPAAPARSPADARAPSSAYATEFYESINSAVEDPASGRTLRLEGVGAARRGGGDALVATREGTAYVRVRLRNVPPPARYGVRKYVMWAELPEDGPRFLRALPARRLNSRTIYARRRDVNSGDFTLAVTAERRYPRARPRGRRVLAIAGRAPGARD